MNIFQFRLFGFTIIDLQWGNNDGYDFVEPHDGEHIIFPNEQDTPCKHSS